MPLIIENADDQSLDYLYRRLAIESTVGSDVITLFKQLVPKSANLIKSYVPSLSHFLETQPSEGRIDDKQRHELLKLLKSVNFLAYEDTLISVPEGFKGQLIPYLEVLLRQSSVVLAHGKKVMQDYNTELSMFLSNVDIRSSLKSHEAHYTLVRQERESYQKAINAFFEKNSTRSRQKLSTVISRFQDLDKVFVLENKLKAVKDSQDFKGIVAEVQRATDMLTLIKARLDKGDISGVSGQTAKNIAEGAYEVARYAEYTSIYGYFLETTLASINNTAEQLMHLFKR